MTRSHPVRLCGKGVLATFLILVGTISQPWGGVRVSAATTNHKDAPEMDVHTIGPLHETDHPDTDTWNLGLSMETSLAADEIQPMEKAAPSMDNPNAGDAVHEPLTEDEPAAATGNLAAERLSLYDQISILTGIPWYFLAAVDQYERNIAAVKKLPVTDRPISIYYTEAEWAGAANPNPQDTDIRTIALFGGIGLDGDGDGKADRNNDLDVLYTAAAGLLKHGISREDFRIALWERYQNSRSVDRIWQFATIYHHFGTIELNQHVFPLPLGANYSYRSTWGDKRGWGGRRIHEGTDIFAGYGVPVRSTCYGIVEVKGWNPYGGWRIGIRDTNSVYHYFAHLSGFEKNLKVGDVVKPGQVIGWVGSSGYGKPGTSGKFPPHLHYGMYKDNGLTEWSFDPYPYLRKWEREERQSKKR